MRTTTAIVLCLLAASTLAQTVHTDFETGVPAEWVQTDTSIVDRMPSGKALQITGSIATLTSPAVADAGRLTFWLRSPQPGDSYTLVIERAKAADAPASEWVPVDSIPQVGPAAGAQDERYASRISHFEERGTSYFRWRLRDYVRGAAVIDDITIERMSPEAFDNAKRREEDEKIRKAFVTFNKAATYDQAVSAFAASATQYKNQLDVLLQLREHTASIAALLQTASAVGKRADMANPLKYELFNQIKNDLSKVLPPLKQERLKDIESSITETFSSSERFTRLKSAISGIANVALSVGTAITGINLRGVLDDFKSMLVDGYSPDNLQTIFQGRGRGERILQAAQKGLTDYQNARAFVNAILEDNERVTRLNAELTSTRMAAEALSASLNTNIRDYLGHVGATDEEKNKFIANPTPELVQALESRADQTIASAAGPKETWRAEVSAETASQKLRDLESAYRRVDDLEDQYRRLVSATLEYYADFIADLEQPAPFKDDPSRNRWTEGQKEARGLITDARANFRKAHENIPRHK